MTSSLHQQSHLPIVVALSNEEEAASDEGEEEAGDEGEEEASY